MRYSSQQAAYVCCSALCTRRYRSPYINYAGAKRASGKYGGSFDAHTKRKRRWDGGNHPQRIDKLTYIKCTERKGESQVEDEKVIAYLARKVYELETQLKCVQSNCDYYYNLAKQHDHQSDDTYIPN